MPTILDANIFSLLFTHEFRPVLDALKNGEIILVYGGTKQLCEYKLLGSYIQFVIELQRNGFAKLLDAKVVDAQERTVKGTGLCTSDDEHIIAIALVSKARLLCSHDKALHADFKNPNLINCPRGKVYQNSKHKHLIRHGR